MNCNPTISAKCEVRNAKLMRNSEFGMKTRAKHISSPRGHIEHEVHIVRHRRISMRCVLKGTTLIFRFFILRV